MANFKIHPLWATPIFDNHIPVKKSYLDYAKNQMYERMESNNGDITSNSYVLEDLPDLKAEIVKQANLYLHDFLKVETGFCSFYLANSWIVRHKKNDWAHLHHHGNAMISGVYYLQTFENCGDIYFERVYSNIFQTNVEPAFSEYNHMTSGEYKVPSEDGRILLFPAHVKHGVSKNNTDKERYCLAFNLHIKGTLGGKISQVTIA